jgi:hypothetical protein
MRRSRLSDVDEIRESQSPYEHDGAKSTAACAVLAVLFVNIVNSQDPPCTGTYKIRSGLYHEFGGISGHYELELPAMPQTFVSLAVPDNGPAELSFLNDKEKEVFVRLTNGIVSENTIRFQYETLHPYGLNWPAQVDYTISNAAGRLWISGSITSAPVGPDIPDVFMHQDTRATFMPVLSIRVANDVELRWTSASNQDYQVQWKSDFAQLYWTNVGGTVQGNGATNYAVDPAAAASSQGFYRILTLP